MSMKNWLRKVLNVEPLERIVYVISKEVQKKSFCTGSIDDLIREGIDKSSYTRALLDVRLSLSSAETSFWKNGTASDIDVPLHIFFDSDTVTRIETEVKYREMYKTFMDTARARTVYTALRVFLGDKELFEKAKEFVYGPDEEGKQYLSPEAMMSMKILRNRLDDISFVSYEAREAAETLLNEIEEKFCTKRVEEK